jgi:[ribosomal protein S18]-alanine N-acetyltransferase
MPASPSSASRGPRGGCAPDTADDRGGPQGTSEPASSEPPRFDAPVAGDARQLWELDRVCFPDPWSHQGWRDELTASDRVWRLVWDRGRVAAAAGLWLAPDAAHVLRLAVAPSRRGRGLATHLVDELGELAARAGRTALTLEVRASNRAALSLYRRLDFVSHGLRPGYYPDGEDAVILWRSPPGGDGHDLHGR